MNENDTRIVRIRNIFDFDFTGELGARYGGRDFPIPAGSSLLVPFPLGDHLATHLARQSIIRNAPLRDGSETDGKGSDRPLWSDQAIEDVKKRLISDVYEEEKAPVLSEADRMAAKIEELNSNFEPKADEEPVIDPTASPVEYKDKAEVIEALKKRGITFNARSSKATLEGLLTD